ncbi:MAG TPA: hypothetical protein VN493_24275 [Thermoanaerobaculia bacterium]|nr:hypothetical protein [Thermoanaerobaculia bacterium]
MDRLRFLPAVLLFTLALSPPFSPPVVAKDGGSEIVTSPSSGHLTVTGDRIDVRGSFELDPCVERLAVAVTPLVKVTGLGKLKGTLRAGGDVPAGAVVSKHYLVEGKMTVRDGIRILAENLNVFVAATAPKPGAESEVKEMEGRISLDWDGLSWSQDGVSVPPQGNYTADVEVLLLRAVVDKNAQLLREEILDRGVIRVAIQLGPKIDECRAWARIAPGLGKGPDDRVLVHGQPSVEKPWISWRSNRPSAIFGDMGKHPGPATPRVSTVKQFLNNNLDLFGITDPRVVGTLGTVSENPDPDGTIRLRLRQSTTVGSSPVRAEEGEMTAVFDSTGELVFLGGRFLESLPLQVPAAQILGSQATDAVTADLTAKGIQNGRDVHLLDQVLFGDDLFSYELAWRVGVDPAEHASSSEPPAERDRSFEYWVSARTGRVLHVRNHTHQSLSTLVTVFDFDPELIYGENSYVSEGREGAIDRNLWIRINNPTGGHWWLDDGDASTGVVSETFIDDPYDSQPRWSSANLDGGAADMGGGDFATDREKRKAFTAFRQIQQFWDRFGSRFTSSWSDVDLLVQHGDLDDELGGQYSVYWGADNEVRLSKDWLEVSLGSIPLYAPAHEAFHHFDWETVDLERADGDDHRMPGAIKEGMASAAMHWTDPQPVTNVQGAGAALFLCLATWDGVEKFRECLDLGVNTFRKAGVTYDHRPYKNGGATRHPVEPWPDCRTIDTNVWVPVGCSLVLPPDQATDDTFKFRGRDNDVFSRYFFVQKVMLDLWETVSSVAAASGSLSDGELYAEKFPDVALKAFLLLDDEPSFVDLRNAMRVASALSIFSVPFSPEILAAVDDTFARHGIDATLESFCADSANEDFCH